MNRAVVSLAALGLLAGACSGSGSDDLIVSDSADRGGTSIVPSTSEAPVVGTRADGDDEAVVVEIDMVEFGYEPSEVTIPAGERVILRFRNLGAIEHEAMLGSRHEQEEFEAAGHMTGHGDDGDGHGGHGDAAEGHHGKVAAITLGSGESGDLVVEYDGPQDLLIGCHLAGHWSAGMVATLRVV